LDVVGIAAEHLNEPTLIWLTGNDQMSQYCVTLIKPHIPLTLLARMTFVTPLHKQWADVLFKVLDLLGCRVSGKQHGLWKAIRQPSNCQSEPNSQEVSHEGQQVEGGAAVGGNLRPRF